MAGIDDTAGDLSKEASGVTSEQARAATHVPMTEEQMRAVQVGELAPLVGPIHIVDYDPEWPWLFEREAERVQATLGDRVLLIEHVGSTSVPGLAAKPSRVRGRVLITQANQPLPSEPRLARFRASGSPRASTFIS